jgi:hypothetical protein
VAYQISLPTSDYFADTEEYYDKLINGDEESKGLKRNRSDDEDEDDQGMRKMARRDNQGMQQWPMGMYPGMAYGYPPPMYPMGAHGGAIPGHPMPGYPVPLRPNMHTPDQRAPAGVSQPKTQSSTLGRSQSSAGTSRNTPSQASDSDSSQDATATNGVPKSSIASSTNKPIKPISGLEKRVSFAEQVHERSVSPAPPKAAGKDEEYNPWVKG